VKPDEPDTEKGWDETRRTLFVAGDSQLYFNNAMAKALEGERYVKLPTGGSSGVAHVGSKSSRALASCRPSITRTNSFRVRRATFHETDIIVSL